MSGYSWETTKSRLIMMFPQHGNFWGIPVDKAYPLANVYTAIENHYFKSKINYVRGSCSIAMLNYRRIFFENRSPVREFQRNNGHRMQTRPGTTSFQVEVGSSIIPSPSIILNTTNMFPKMRKIVKIPSKTKTCFLCVINMIGERDYIAIRLTICYLFTSIEHISH